MTPRYSETKFTEKEMSILAMVFQYMKVQLQVDWDAGALALGYKNAGSLRSYWNQIFRTKIDPAGPAADSGLRKRKRDNVGDGDGNGDEAVAREATTKKRKAKVAGAGRSGQSGGYEDDGEAWFGAPTSATDDVDRPIKIEEEAASALAPIMAFNDDFAADATKSKETKATNVAAQGLNATKARMKGHAAGLPKARKKKGDQDAAYVPAQVPSWIVEGDADAGKVKEKDPLADTAPAPVAPMGGSAELSSIAANDKVLIIPGGTMTPRKQKRKLVEDEKPKKKKAASTKAKVAIPEPDGPHWTDYIVRERTAAYGEHKDGSKVAAKNPKPRIDGRRKAAPLAGANGKKKVDGGHKRGAQPVDAAKTIKPEPETAISIEKGNGGFNAEIANTFGSFDNGCAAAVMAPTFSEGYYGSVGINGQTDGSFSASTDPDNGRFFQEAFQSFDPGHSYPEKGVQGVFVNAYTGNHDARIEYGGFVAPQYGGHTQYVGQPQYAEQPQYIGYPGWPHPAYGPVDYQYPAAGFGFGPIG